MIFRAITALTIIAFVLMTASCDDDSTPADNNPADVMIQGVVTDANGIGLEGVALHIIYEIDTSSVSPAESPLTIRRSSAVLDSVELSSFELIPGDNEVTVSWYTASETNCDYFDIQRNDEIVARIDATNLATESHYTWTDQGVYNDTTYTYELVSADLDGGRQTLASASAMPSSEHAVVTEYALHQNFPNPVQDTTSIALDLPEANFVTLKIFQPDETEIATLISGNWETGRYSVSYYTGDLANGFYEYHMTAGASFSANRTMLKNTTDYTALRSVPGNADADGNGHFEFDMSTGDSTALYDTSDRYLGSILLQRATIVALAPGYEPADTTISLSRGMHHTLTFVLTEQ
jgi:hypothetical protein